MDIGELLKTAVGYPAEWLNIIYFSLSLNDTSNEVDQFLNTMLHSSISECVKVEPLDIWSEVDTLAYRSCSTHSHEKVLAFLCNVEFKGKPA